MFLRNTSVRMRTLLTTQNQNCYREMIMKEAYARFAWKLKYGKDYPIRFTSRRSKTMDLFKSTTAPKVTLPPVVLPQKKAKSLAPQRPLHAAPLMRPASPQSKDALYHGLSKEGKGRSLYLKRRGQQGPEEKFEYPVLSSWEYGWRLGDYGYNYKSPANGRSGVVRSAFYARNGIFNIPAATDHLG